MALQPTVDYMIEQVRSRLDLATNEGIKNVDDILPALNRAKDYAFDVLGRIYPEPILKELEVEISSASYGTFPDDIFEDRLLQLEWKAPSGLYDEINRLSYRQKHLYESTSTGAPEYHVIKGRNYELVPTPSNGTVRITYLRNPEDYVTSLGRITGIDTANNKLTLDSINSSLTTSTASLGAYVNVVDAHSGEIKYSVQVKTIDTDNSQITLKSTASRASVLGRTIQTSLTDLDITEDDHICAINGTCIPFFRRPVSNFCIEYATAEMKDKLQREGQDLAQQVLDKFEKQIERTWARRELTRRVRKENKHFKESYTGPLRWRIR